MTAPEVDAAVGRDRTVVFDLYGVLARHQDPAGQRVLEDLLGVHHQREVLWDAYWAERPANDRGDLDATTFWSAVAASVGRSVPEALVPALVAADVESWSRLDDAMLDLVAQLHGQGRELALLSNAPVEIAEHLRGTQPWLSLFTSVAFSCEIGAVKPEPAAFAAVEGRLGRRPDELVLVDDRAENVAGARARGWAGIRFRDRATLAPLLGLDV